MSLFAYPNQRYTSQLGLALFGQEEIIAENFLLIDAAYAAGSSISVNGTLVTSPNLSSTLPVAPAGKSLVTFQTDINGNISAYVTPGGGGGTPASPNTSIQFNNSGVFGGDANFVWDDTTHKLTLGPTTNQGYITYEATPFLYAENTNTDTVGGTRGPFTFPYSFNTFLNPPSSSAVELFNIDGLCVILSGCAQNFTSELCGGHFEGDHNGTGNAAVLIGCAGEAYNLNNGTVTQLSAMSADAGTLVAGKTGAVIQLQGLITSLYNSGGATVTYPSAVRITSPHGAVGVFANYVGLQIDSVVYDAVHNPNPLAINIVDGNSNMGSGVVTLNNVRAGDGTSTAPSISFTNSTDVGLYKSGNSALGIAANNVALAQFDDAAGLRMLNGLGVVFSGTNVASTDTGLSRTAAGTLAIGNGTLGNKTGTIDALKVVLDGAAAELSVLSGATKGVQLDFAYGIGLYNGGGLGWAAAGGALDTGFSRPAAATIALGNGTLFDFTGTLQLAHVQSGDGTTASTSLGFKAEITTGFIRLGVGSIGIVNSGSIDAVMDNAFGTTLTAQSGLGFSNTTVGSRDASISRLGAASLAIGNGTLGNSSGNLSLNRISKAGTDFAGQATITAGGTTKAVAFGANYTGTGQPVVVLTPTSDPLALGVPVGYWVTYSGGAGAWTGFTVNIQTALAGNVTFNYIVVGQA